MPDLRAPTMTEILDAVKNISGKAIRSPLIKFQGDTSGIQAEIWLKLENLQPTGKISRNPCPCFFNGIYLCKGAFKVRPASNAIACISNKTRLTTAGVCTASAGNFAQVREMNTPFFLDKILGLGLVLHIPDNCRRRGRRRQCKFFWQV